MERSRINGDALSGLLFVTCGVFGLWISRDLAAGTAGAMGPGYLPRVLCACMIGLGLVIAVRGLLRTGLLEAWQLRPLLAILGSIFLFAVILPKAGLFIAALLTVVVGSFGTKESRFFEVLVLAVGSAVLTVLIFVYTLGLPMIPWPF